MGNFTFISTQLPDVVIVEPAVFGDTRGYFMETYHKEEFTAAGITCEFVQDNQSMSRQGVLRGLHFQTQHTQAKLVRVISGRVFDVGVDVRPGSPTFGRWASAELNAENRRMLYVPQGFAHGFLVLSESAEFTYKCSDVYAPAFEGGVRWDDPDIGIKWPDVGMPFSLSEKDKALPLLKDSDTSFFERWAR